MFDFRRQKSKRAEQTQLPEKPESTAPEPVTPAPVQEAVAVASPAAAPASESPITPNARTATVIGPSVKILGDIISDESLVVEGEVEGTITCNAHSVTVGKAGKLKANVSAKEITIDGALEGNVSGLEKITVTASGVVRGNLVAPRVILEDGARFKGSIDMEADVKAAAPTTTQKDGSQVDVANPVQSPIGPKAVKGQATDGEKRVDDLLSSSSQKTAS